MISKNDKTILWIVLGMIGMAITCAVVFYGTVAAIAYHFLHKFW